MFVYLLLKVCALKQTDGQTNKAPDNDSNCGESVLYGMRTLSRDYHVCSYLVRRLRTDYAWIYGLV